MTKERQNALAAALAELAELQAIADYLNEIARLCHAESCAAGWWDPENGRELRTDPYVIGTKLALIHSEISEALEGHRKGLMDDKLPRRPAVEVELADAVIRICDLAGVLNLDLGGAVVEKLRYNRKRADHQPGNRQLAGGKRY